MKPIIIKTTHELDADDLINLLSGMRMSYYWAQDAGALDLVSTQQRIMDGGTYTVKEFDESDDKVIARYPLNLKTLKKGLEKLASEYPRHWADIVNDNDDADTADAVLQLSTIGTIKYG